MINLLSSIFGTNLHYFLNRGLWLTGAQIIASLAAFCTSVFMADALDESIYGSYRYMIAIAAMLSVFSFTGAGQAIFQAASKNITSFLSIATRYSAIYSAPLVIASIATATYYYIQQDYTLSLACFAISFIQPIINIFQGIGFYLQGSHKYKEATGIQVVRAVISAASLFVALLFTYNPLALFLVYLCSRAIVNLCAHLLFKPQINKHETEPGVISKYLSYAKHSSIRNILNGVASTLDSILVFQQLGASALAIYSISNLLPEQIKGSVKNLSLIVLQKFSDINNTQAIIKALPKRTLQLFIVLFFFTVLYCLLVPLLYSIFFPKYPEAVLLSQILALSFPAHAAILPYGILQTEMKEKFLYHIQVYVSVTSIILMVAGTFFFGVIGTAAGRVLSRYINLLVCYVFARQIKD